MKDKSNKSLERRLKDAIEANGLSVTATAREIGVTHGAVYRWLIGENHIAIRHRKSVEDFISKAAEYNKRVSPLYAKSILNDESKMKCIIDYLSRPKNKYELVRLYKLALKDQNDKSRS
ncbi:hypothetical protein P0136_10550 [Lentisphaerota bacterium ZTH]|nr:hypothetical protein JYG24_11940 [Lentisphaerota bacterium]WET05800.1 hypothetical protein P0136_10550 [Lentisphaerota bacterium ZTH]